MFKRLLCMLCFVGLLLVVPLQTMAVITGEIRITPHRQGKAVSGGSIGICYVGTIADEGYLVPGKNKNQIIKKDELFLPETAAWIERNVNKEFTVQTVGETGSVSFTGLERGLYLVTQPKAAAGYVPFRSFLVELPVGGISWLAEAFPKAEKILSDNPQTGDHPAPIIAAMILVLSVSALLVLSDKRKK